MILILHKVLSIFRLRTLCDFRFMEYEPMNILVLGNGGREHALAWKIAQDEQSRKSICSTG